MARQTTLNAPNMHYNMKRHEKKPENHLFAKYENLTNANIEAKNFPQTLKRPKHTKPVALASRHVTQDTKI